MTLNIMLSTGQLLDLNDPDPDLITLEEVANSLSKQCRFGGKCREFYSVAQHSVLCSYFTTKEYCLAALLHDAGEGILQDIIHPYKHLCPALVSYEDLICDIIADKVGLERGFHHHPVVKKTDMQCFASEVRALFDPLPPESILECGDFLKHGDLNGAEYPDPELNIQADEDIRIIEFHPPNVAKQHFLNCFKELTGRSEF